MLPSSHSRWRIVRARSVDGSKRATVVSECPLDDIVEPDRLARDADWKQLLAGPELFCRELERFEHTQALLPLEVHVSDKHRTRWEHNGDGVRLRAHGRLRAQAQGSGLKQEHSSLAEIFLGMLFA